MFAATGNVILPSRALVSTDHGASWTAFGTLTEETIRSLATDGSRLYAGTDGAGVWRISL